MFAAIDGALDVFQDKYPELNIICSFEITIDKLFIINLKLSEWECSGDKLILLIVEAKRLQMCSKAKS